METSRDAGFSLIELIVVVVILGLLAVVIGPNVVHRGAEAKRQIASVQISELEQALEAFYFDNSCYPTTTEGLEALIENPGVPNWSGPYLKKRKIPVDPWNREFQYRSPGQFNDCDIWSLGADGLEGGEGEAADIVSW